MIITFVQFSVMVRCKLYRFDDYHLFAVFSPGKLRSLLANISNPIFSKMDAHQVCLKHVLKSGNPVILGVIFSKTLICHV